MATDRHGPDAGFSPLLIPGENTFLCYITKRKEAELSVPYKLPTVRMTSCFLWGLLSFHLLPDSLTVNYTSLCVSLVAFPFLFLSLPLLLLLFPLYFFPFPSVGACVHGCLSIGLSLSFSLLCVSSLCIHVS